MTERREPPISEAINMLNARKAVENGKQKVESPGERFGRLIRQKAQHILAIQDNATDPAGEKYTQAQEGIATVDDEFRTKCLHGNEFDTMLQAVFDLKVSDRLIAIHEDRRDQKRAEKFGELLRERKKEIAGDWDTINKVFPNQFEEPRKDIDST